MGDEEMKELLELMKAFSEIYKNFTEGAGLLEILPKLENQPEETQLLNNFINAIAGFNLTIQSLINKQNELQNEIKRINNSNKAAIISDFQKSINDIYDTSAKKIDSTVQALTDYQTQVEADPHYQKLVAAISSVAKIEQNIKEETLLQSYNHYSNLLNTLADHNVFDVQANIDFINQYKETYGNKADKAKNDLAAITPPDPGLARNDFDAVVRGHIPNPNFNFEEYEDSLNTLEINATDITIAFNAIQGVAQDPSNANAAAMNMALQNFQPLNALASQIHQAFQNHVITPDSEEGAKNLSDLVIDSLKSEVTAAYADLEKAKADLVQNANEKRTDHENYKNQKQEEIANNKKEVEKSSKDFQDMKERFDTLGNTVTKRMAIAKRQEPFKEEVEIFNKEQEDIFNYRLIKGEYFQALKNKIVESDAFKNLKNYAIKHEDPTKKAEINAFIKELDNPKKQNLLALITTIQGSLRKNALIGNRSNAFLGSLYEAYYGFQSTTHELLHELVTETTRIIDNEHKNRYVQIQIQNSIAKDMERAFSSNVPKENESKFLALSNKLKIALDKVETSRSKRAFLDELGSIVGVDDEKNVEKMKQMVLQQYLKTQASQNPIGRFFSGSKFGETLKTFLIQELKMTTWNLKFEAAKTTAPAHASKR